MSMNSLGLGRGGAGHAGELVIEAEIVLEGDRGERLVLRLDGHVLLGFERLMQAFGIAPAGHHAAGELVDDDDLVVLDDVILVALEQLVGAQGLVAHGERWSRSRRRRDWSPLSSPAAPSTCSRCSLPFSVSVNRALLLVEFVVLGGRVRE